jgi:hypothetical protein
VSISSCSISISISRNDSEDSEDSDCDSSDPGVESSGGFVSSTPAFKIMNESSTEVNSSILGSSTSRMMDMFKGRYRSNADRQRRDRLEQLPRANLEAVDTDARDWSYQIVDQHQSKLPAKGGYSGIVTRSTIGQPLRRRTRVGVGLPLWSTSARRKNQGAFSPLGPENEEAQVESGT